MKLGFFSKQVANGVAPSSPGDSAGGVESEGGSSATSPVRDMAAPAFVGHAAACLDRNGMTALHQAASAGDVPALTELLQHHPDPDVTDRWGRTPLHYAAIARRGQGAIELLIERGADPHRLARTRRSPLQLAAGAGSGLTMRSFLGALLKSFDARRRALQTGSLLSPHIVQAQRCNFELLSECVRLAALRNNGDALAALIKFIKPVKHVHWSDQPHRPSPTGGVAPALVNAEQARILERRAVIWVAQAGNTALLCALKRRGVDLNMPNERRFSPLLRLAYHGDSTGVAALLGAGVDVNSRGPRGYTALHLAAAMGHSEVVQLLRKKGANANAQNDRGHIPLDTAIVLDEVGGMAALCKPRTLAERLGWAQPQRAPKFETVCAVRAEAMYRLARPCATHPPPPPPPIDELVRAEVRSAK